MLLIEYIILALKSKAALDSGLSKHYTGKLLDLINFKKQNTPRQIKIVNNTLINTIGYSIILLKGFSFKHIQFVLLFGSIKLLLVKALDKEGYTITFKEGTIVYTKDNIRVFSALISGSLYILDIAKYAKLAEL